MLTQVFRIASAVALMFAFYFYHWMLKKDGGTEIMEKVAFHVRVGAMSYLKQQYEIVAEFILTISLPGVNIDSDENT